jgi:hypothetical protein
MELIAAIEQSFDVNSVKYKDLMVWPLIRMDIWQQYCDNKKYINNAKANTHRSNNIQILEAPENQLKLLSEYKNVDMLFFTTRWGQRMDTSESIELREGNFFSPFIDSMIDLIKDNYRFLKMELYSHQIQKKLSRYEPTVFIQPAARGYKVDTTKSIDGFSDIQQVVKNISGIWVNEGLFIDQARFILSWEVFFTEILSVVRPKSVFFVTYSQLSISPLIKACKNLHIPTVTIIHGNVGYYYAGYTQWTKLPSDGYDLLPDYFWCWGQKSRNSIIKWFPPSVSHHRVIVGGNLKLTNWFAKDSPADDDDIKILYEQLKHKNKIILVSMTMLELVYDPNMNMQFPESLLNAMQRSPYDWFWLIRLHPFSRSRERKKQLSEIMKKSGVANYEFEKSNSNSVYALFNLLKICDHNVTDMSTSCLEALVFNVPSTIIGTTGLQFYEDEIRRGIFTYADTGEKILASIKQSFSNPKRITPSEYIETDRQIVEDALEVILSNKKPLDPERKKIHAQAMNQLGTDLFKRRYVKAALNTFLKAAEADPNSAMICNNLGVLYMQSGDRNKALSYFASALETSPDNRAIISNVVEFLKILGKTKTSGNMSLLF